MLFALLDEILARDYGKEDNVVVLKGNVTFLNQILLPPICTERKRFKQRHGPAVLVLENFIFSNEHQHIL